MRGAPANGDEIRAARVERGLTQEQLAGMAELDVKTVRKAEQGGRMDVGSLVSLALALEIDVSSVISTGNRDADTQHVQRKVVECWLAAWDDQDIDGVLSVYHDEGVMNLPGAPGIPFSGAFVGKSEIQRGTELAWATAQTVPQGPEAYTFVISDDSVVIYGLKGVYTPDGDVVRLPCMQIFNFDGDLIVEHSVEYDTLALRRVLGLAPPDESRD